MFHSTRREYPGSKPYSYGLVGRNAPLRHQEKMKIDTSTMFDETKIIPKQDLLINGRCEWEEVSEKSMINHKVKKNIDDVLKADKINLISRQEKLLKLLKCEEEMYRQEVLCREETILERQARMREKARILRDKRERSRLALVEEKLEQRFRQQCDDLRTLNFQRNEQQTCEDRHKQVELKQKIRQNEKECDKFYHNLLLEDLKAKDHCAEMEKMAELKRDKDILESLNEHRKYLEHKKQQAEELKQQQAALLRDEAINTKLEEEKDLQKKYHQQRELKQYLDESICLKEKRRAEEIQEELEYNMKLMQKIEKDIGDEEFEKSLKKELLRRDQEQYVESMRDERAKDKALKLEIENYINKDNANQWKKREDCWATVKKARDKLMHDVSETVRQQIEERRVQNEQLRNEILMNTEQAQKNYEQICLLAAEERKKKREENRKYQDDLLGQIAYKKKQKKIEEDFLALEIQKQHEEAMKYQNNLAKVLASTRVTNAHPAKMLYSVGPKG